MRDVLCAAFCDELSLTEVPAGYAVSTPFAKDNGDAVTFFVVRDKAFPDHFRIEDDGTTIPFLEAAGVDFSTTTRSEAFSLLRSSHGVEFDEAENLLTSGWLAESDMPRAALRFVNFMIRINDFLLLTRDKAASTFRDDAIRALKERLIGRAIVEENAAVSLALSENRPDALIRVAQRRPVALFLGTSPQRVYEAILLNMQALYEAREDVAVVVLLETDTTINRDLRRRASNRLTAVPTFRGDEVAAIDRIGREALGEGFLTLH